MADYVSVKLKENFNFLKSEFRKLGYKVGPERIHNPKLPYRVGLFTDEWEKIGWSDYKLIGTYYWIFDKDDNECGITLITENFTKRELLSFVKQLNKLNKIKNK
jgi:flavin-dependent dehydrogenase